jgi:PqqD family protein of HPr-rel-A system
VLWLASKSDDLIWAAYEEDDPIVFHRPSGKTHLLNVATALLLKRVLTSPLSTMEAVRRLAELQGVALDDEFESAVTESLHRLDHLGLVERRDP